KGDISQAEVLFTKAKALNPMDFETRMRIARIYYQNAGMEANALEEYWQIIALAKGTPYAEKAQAQLDRLLLGVSSSDLSVAEESERRRLNISVEEDFLKPQTSETEETAPEKHLFLKDFRFNGYLRNETAYRFREPRSFTKIRNTLNLEVSMPLGSKMSFTASGWAYHDSVYDLFNYDTITARFRREEGQPLVFIEQLSEEKDSDVADLREFYLDVFLSSMDLRIGKQWVVWGVLEGIRIVDEINPYDFRELIMPDLLDFRVPLWTVKADYYSPIGDIELLWIPDVQFHKPAPPGSEWELLQAVPNTVTPDRWDLKNSELGIRLSREVLGMDMSFSYFYTWDDFPVIFRRVRLLENEDPIFFPTYTRIHMFGSTFTRQTGPVILKGEIAYVLNKYFGIADIDVEGAFDSNGNPKGDGFLDRDGEA
ncbi:MAG: tetratricopeptide repeat protein, partial [Gammaproteobacteria bacterium]